MIKRLPGGLFTSTANCNVRTGSDSQLDDKGSLSSDSGVDVADWTTKIDDFETVINMSTASIQNGASYYMAGLTGRPIMVFGQ